MAGVTGEQDWYISGVFSMSFINLNDTFGDYIDRAGTVPKVNASEDALIPSDTKIDAHASRHKDGGPDELDVVELSGAIGSAGQVPTTDGAAVTWVDLAHGNLSGISYNDHHSVGTGIIWDVDNNIAHKAVSVHEAGGALEVIHNNLVLASDDHHSRYTDFEAIVAINNDADHGSTAQHNYFNGDHADLSNVLADQHHAKYTNAEAINAVEGNANVFTSLQKISRPENTYFLYLEDSDTNNSIRYHIASDGVFWIRGFRSNDSTYFNLASFHPTAGYWQLECDIQVSQSELKTSVGSVNADIHSERTLPGGTWGFFPQIKTGTGGDYAYWGMVNSASSAKNDSTTYMTKVVIGGEDQYTTAYMQQRYVTSSGEVHWIFILRDKLTKEIISAWQAPDHPCFGNGGKPDLVPHPFPDFDPLSEEILVITMTPEEFEDKIGKYIEDEDGLEILDPLQVIENRYDIDDSTEPSWPEIPVTVGLPRRAKIELGRKVIPIKKRIPKPDIVRTAQLYAL